MIYGRVAYEAYCKTTDNKSLISGAELPKWEALKPEIRNAWDAAGEAVHDYIFEPDQVTQAARRGFESIQHKG